jgi:hypothetical protein
MWATPPTEIHDQNSGTAGGSADKCWGFNFGKKWPPYSVPVDAI